VSRAAVRLRRATLADAPAMARVMRAAVRAERGYPPGALAAWAALPALYHRWAMTAGGERRAVAEVGGRVVGFAGWRGREVTALFVRPGAAGLGLGARLLARAEAGARRSRARTLTVLAARGAVPFYLARGWRAVRPEPSPLPGGRGLPAMRMGKPAAAPPGAASATVAPRPAGVRPAPRGRQRRRARGGPVATVPGRGEATRTPAVR
jgi:GNAT superfamily N-acetyltransferase